VERQHNSTMALLFIAKSRNGTWLDIASPLGKI